jgi:hypothetical protein
LVLVGLAAHLFGFVANALSLVGLRLSQGANLGGKLADELFVDAFDVFVSRAGPSSSALAQVDTL